MMIERKYGLHMELYEHGAEIYYNRELTEKEMNDFEMVRG